MDDEDRALAFGEFMQAAREALGLSIRRAAHDAGISEGLWRQIEKGYRQVTKDVRVPTNPRPTTVVAMARAVHLTPVAALHAAGLHADAEYVAAHPTDGSPWVVELPPETAVLDAIEQDPHLLPEAKEHLMRQYGLLRRVSPLPETQVAPSNVVVEIDYPHAARRGKPKKTRGQDEQPL